MKKIAISGIGGVGGYFGGLLAKKCANSSQTEIFFIARGENEKTICQNGLRMETTSGNLTVHPKMVTSDAGMIGVVDLLICSSKGYDLQKMVSACKPCIGKDTVLLPLLNGVDAKEKIQTIFPENEIWDGCVYLVSRLAEPGVIKETGNVRKLFFGSATGTKKKMISVEKIFTDAGIEAILSNNILETIWEKFLFISPIATLTSYLDKTIGEVFADEEARRLLQLLLVEIQRVADVKGITLAKDITKKNIEKMTALPFDATTSMHSDFRKGGATELESLTGYVMRCARELRVEVPTYEMMHEELKRK